MKSFALAVVYFIFMILIGFLFGKGCERITDIYVGREYNRTYDSKILICSEGDGYKLIKNFKFIRFKDDSLFVFDNDTDKFYNALYCYKYSDKVMGKNINQ